MFTIIITGVLEQEESVITIHIRQWQEADCIQRPTVS